MGILFCYGIFSIFLAIIIAPFNNKYIIFLSQNVCLDKVHRWEKWINSNQVGFILKFITEHLYLLCLKILKFNFEIKIIVYFKTGENRYNYRSIYSRACTKENEWIKYLLKRKYFFISRISWNIHFHLSLQGYIWELFSHFFLFQTIHFNLIHLVAFKRTKFCYVLFPHKNAQVSFCYDFVQDTE